jgi:hypothetical protein
VCRAMVVVYWNHAVQTRRTSCRATRLTPGKAKIHFDSAKEAHTADYHPPMGTAARQDDMVNLAAVLLGIGDTNETAAYRPGELFFDVLQSPFDFDELTIDIFAETNNLPEALAVLAAVQLSVDAAAAAVEYRFRTRSEGQDDDPDRVIGLLRELGQDFGWDLEIVELSAGSIRARLRKILNSSDDRKKILAVAGLAAAVATGILGGWVPAIPGLVVAVLAVGDAFAPQDAPRPPEALAQLAKNQNATTEQVVQLQTANQKLTEELAKVKLESFDRIAALEARIEQLTLIVADRQAA